MEPAPKKKKHTRQIEELPYEIWDQILLCLPVRTVIELKSVCRSWLKVINSQHFRLSHVDRWRRSRDNTLIVTSKHRLALVSFDSVGDDEVLRCCPLRFDFERLCLRRSQCLSGPTDTTVLDCCDGLFLVRISKQYMFLCNPLTNSYLPLPSPNRKVFFTHSWTVVYNPSTRGYVIFCIDFRPPGIYTVSSLRIELNDGGGGGHGRESVNNWRWQQLWSSKTLTPDASLSFPARMSINSKAHYLYAGEKYGILTIDAATEESIFTKFPFRVLKSGVFFASNKKFYCLKDSSSGETFELWAVDDVDNPTWLKHHVILKMNPQERRSVYRYLPILKEGNRLIIHIRHSEDMFIYDISLKKWQAINFVDSKSLCRGYEELEFMSINYSLLSW